MEAVIADVRTQRKFTSVGLPAWCCETMIEPFRRAGMRIQFYPVYPSPCGGVIREPEAAADCDGLVLMDYFGYTAPSAKLSAYDGVIIRDATHSLFSETPRDADYIFGSLRKWAGFWTGGYAWKLEGGFSPPVEETTNETYVALRRWAMEKKRAYLSGRRTDKGYLELYAQAERCLDEEGRSGATVEDIDRARRLDVDLLRRRRRENAVCLLENIADWTLFPQLSENDCPLFVPVLVPNGKRDLLCTALIERGIYCPKHWPVSQSLGQCVKDMPLYRDELSLVCDQRYTPADMERVIREIRELF